MKPFYFPENICILAHIDYHEKSGMHIDQIQDYCKKNVDFFYEVVFSYVEGTPYPKMKVN